MFTSTINNLISIDNLFNNLAETDYLAESSPKVLSRGSLWGFIAKDDLACELATSQPVTLTTSPVAEIDMDDFEKSFHWFLS